MGAEQIRPAWHQDWKDSQGFLHNDDDLFCDPTDEPEWDCCPECDRAGEMPVTFRDPDDRPETRRYATCHRCGGRGYIWQ